MCMYNRRITPNECVACFKNKVEVQYLVLVKNLDGLVEDCGCHNRIPFACTFVQLMHVTHCTDAATKGPSNPTCTLDAAYKLADLPDPIALPCRGELG